MELEGGFGCEVAVLGAEAKIGPDASEADNPEADVLEAEACPLTEADVSVVCGRGWGCVSVSFVQVGKSSVSLMWSTGNNAK